LIALPMSLMRVLPTFSNLGRITSQTSDACRPAQLTDDFIALGLLKQGLKINKHMHHRLLGMTAILPQISPSPWNTGRAKD
jgi:hypothetical protein